MYRWFISLLILAFFVGAITFMEYDVMTPKTDTIGNHDK